MAMMKRMISFTAPQDEYLKREAARLQISISDVIRRIVDAHRPQVPETPGVNATPTRAGSPPAAAGTE